MATNTALATQQQTTLTVTDESGFFTQNDINLIWQSVAKDANAEEFAYFIRVASLRKLNPLLGQIRMNVYSKDNPNKRSATIITTIHGFRLIANRTKRYAPGQAATYEYNAKGQIVSATAYVRVYHPHSKTWQEFSDTAYWDEFNKGDGQWPKMPHVMLAKCAEALALRRGFPEELSGMYTEDEMAQADGPTVNTKTGEIVDVKPVEVKAAQLPAPRMTPDEVKTKWAHQDQEAEALGVATPWQYGLPKGEKLAWYIDEIERRAAILTDEYGRQRAAA